MGLLHDGPLLLTGGWWMRLRNNCGFPYIAEVWCWFPYIAEVMVLLGVIYESSEQLAVTPIT